MMGTCNSYSANQKAHQVQAQTLPPAQTHSFYIGTYKLLPQLMFVLRKMAGLQTVGVLAISALFLTGPATCPLIPFASMDLANSLQRVQCLLCTKLALLGWLC